MNIRNVFFIAALSGSLTTGLVGQTFRRQASIVGGGGMRDRGSCTVEIVVDGAAEIEFRGTDATVTNLKGQMPELRRFECTSPLPPNAAELRFNGVSGRGHQEILNGGPGGAAATVRIDDPENGSDRYVFELSWRNGGPGPGPMTDRRDMRFGPDQAIETCRNEARRQVSERFQTGDVNFRDARIDDAPGRGEWVVGTLEARHPGRPDALLKFSCSVNFQTGQVREAQVEPMYRDGEGRGQDQGRPAMNPRAVENCRRAVEDRARTDGYRRVVTGNINVDDRPGRADWVMGELTADGQYGSQTLRFSCSVDMRDGDVKSVDLNTRR